MSEIFIKLLNMSISAGWLVICVVALRLILKKAPRWIACILWALVAVRLLCPFSLESVLSLVPSAETIPEEIIYSESPEIESGIPVINSTVNPIISEGLAPEQSAEVNPVEIITEIASVVWIVGVAAMAIYAVVSYIRIRKRVSEAVRDGDGVWICDRIDTPFILGLISPRIILPSSLSGEDREYVISHERAHLSRMDHIWKPLGFALLSVYWFNPLIWIGYILLCRDIEAACDEKVIKQLGEGAKKPYASALINCSVPRRMISACPLAFGESGVKERVKNVLNYKKPAFWVIIVAVVACIVVAVCFLTNPKEKKEKTPDKDGNEVVDTTGDETTAETTDSETTTDAETTDDKKDPDETTGIPEETTGVPEETTGIPEETTRVPEDTTGKPIETTPPSATADTTEKENSKQKDTTDKSVTTTPPAATNIKPEKPSDDLLKRIEVDYVAKVIKECGNGPYTYYNHASVYKYYGTYKGAVPVIIECAGIFYTQAEREENVGGYVFRYSSGNGIQVWKNGSFFSLRDAYYHGFITKENLAQISVTKPIVYSSPRDDYSFSDVRGFDIPEVETLEQIEKDYYDYRCSKNDNANFAYIIAYYGEHNGCVPVKFRRPIPGAYMPREVVIADIVFKYSDPIDIIIWENGDFYTLEEAYAQGILTKEEIAVIAEINNAGEYLSFNRR